MVAKIIVSILLIIAALTIATYIVVSCFENWDSSSNTNDKIVRVQSLLEKIFFGVMSLAFVVGIIYAIISLLVLGGTN